MAAAKAVKNEAELDGMREAHLRDAVALAETLLHLEQQVWVSQGPATSCSAPAEHQSSGCSQVVATLALRSDISV